MKKKTPQAMAAQQSVQAIKPSLNREAFLLGLYVELAAVDAIVEPLVKLSPMLSIPKVLLLDAALSRLGEYDTECHLLSYESPRGGRTCRDEDQQRYSVTRSLYTFECTKVKQIAGLLWDGKTELAAWYRTGKAIGGLVEICEDTGRCPSQEAVAYARKCLEQAASHWKNGTIPENGSGLDHWLMEWAGTSDEMKTATRLTEPKNSTHKRVSNPTDIEQLRIVESLATQIQDRTDDTRDEEQRLRDDRDQFIYERFFENYDAPAIRELVNRKIKVEGLKWPILPRRFDVRSVANLYADRFKKPRVPPGKSGRPPRGNRK